MKQFPSPRNIFFLLIILGIAGYQILKPAADGGIFNGLHGPLGTSTVALAIPAAWRAYHEGSDSRLAILLTDEKSSWLGLAHGLKSIGVPFTLTTDYAEALTHKVVLVYPLISGKVLSADALRALHDFPAHGETLIGEEILGGGIEDVFGFSEAVPAKLHTRLTFTHPPADADLLEKDIPIDNPQAANDALGGYSYTKPREILAIYEDGNAAIIEHKFAGGGRAVGFGFDLGALLLKGYDNREENMARSYDNGYEPALDVLLRLIEDIYRHGEDRAMTLRPVPEGKDLAVVITHDIDYTRALMNSVDYARYEKSAGIRGTYFIQTKYIKDYNDDVILSAESPECLQKIRDLGMELGSHTVCHSREFRNFPLGDGTEIFPDYHPFIEDRTTTTGATILGELRVSRFLIEQLTPGVHVESFRPGYLSNPYMLPQALVATDYKFSSSVTANDSLTHLPFQLTYGRETEAEVPIFEFPVTIEDEAPLLSSRLPSGTSVAQKIAKHGGLCVVLIHPNVIDPKLAFEKDFVAGVKDYSWFGGLQDFGHWWAARNSVSVDSSWLDGKLTLHLKAPFVLDGLTVLPPLGMHPVAGQAVVKTVTKNGVVLGPLPQESDIVFSR